MANNNNDKVRNNADLSANDSGTSRNSDAVNSRGKGGNSHSRNGRKSGEKTNYRRWTGDKNGKRQDPYWYAKDEAAVKSFASIPFVQVSGRPITQDSFTANPAMLVVPFVPTIPGTSPRGDDAIDYDTFATKAANAYYQSVAQGFSANFNFEAPDLLFTAIAGVDVMALMLEAPRALSAARKYMQHNSQWAEKVVNALGFNFANIRDNYQDWISAYNIRADQFNDLVAVPKNFFLGERWAHLSANIFSELKDWNAYSTAFAYRHRYRIQYDGTSASTGTCLVYREVMPPTTGFTYNTFFNMIDNMLNALTGDDQREMFGAIRRVYDNESLIKIKPIDLGSVNYDIVYNEVQALQLHNSTFVSDIGFNTPTAIGELLSAAAYQTAGGAILSNPYVMLGYEFTAPIRVDQHIISLCGSDDTSPGAMLDITANILPVWNESAAEDEDMQYCSPRSEILLYPKVYSPVDDTIATIHTFLSNTTAVTDDTFQSYTALSRMDRAPLVYIYDGYGNLVDVIGEIDKYSVVSREFLAELNAKCAYNMLALPLANTKLTSK